MRKEYTHSRVRFYDTHARACARTLARLLRIVAINKAREWQSLKSLMRVMHSHQLFFDRVMMCKKRKPTTRIINFLAIFWTSKLTIKTVNSGKLCSGQTKLHLNHENINLLTSK